MSDGESRSDYGWRSAWGRRPEAPQAGQPGGDDPVTPASAERPDSSETDGTDRQQAISTPNPGWSTAPPVPAAEPHSNGPAASEPVNDRSDDATRESPFLERETAVSEDAPLDNTADEDVSTEPSDRLRHDVPSVVTEQAGPAETFDDRPVPNFQATDTASPDPTPDTGSDDDGDPADDVPAAEEAPDFPPLRSRPLPRVIALANQKGGVGKTTTTINLGAALAEQDHRVLIIDLDPQGNATTGLGINSRALDYSIYDVLLAEVPLEDCVESTSVRNLFIAPASLDLAGAEIELVPAMSREMRLRNAISKVKEDYDYILIDCPPSLGLLTVNALAAADEVMVPIQCEYYALEGLGQLIRNINLVQKNLNTTLELSSIILVMYDGRTKLAEQVSTEVREHFGNVVCRNVIPRNIRLSEAPSYGQPITTFDPSSRGAVAYRELAREVHRVSS